MSVTVSVCMWTYNQEEYIEQAIDSVLMQRDCNYELIIGNDGSTDRTGEICAAYQKRYPNRIRVINHPEHKGLIMITRDCMMAATGKYIAICDSDDWWTDEYKLKKQVEVLEEDSRVSMVHTNWTDYLQDSGKLIERSFVPKSDYLCESTGGGKTVLLK